MKLATLCYVQDKKTNSTLMLHRVKKENDYHRGKWNGLGGKFEPGESPEQQKFLFDNKKISSNISSVLLNGYRMKN